MGVDLGTVLSLMGTVWTGNPLSLDPSFSIGGPSDKVFNIAENLLGLGLLGEYALLKELRTSLIVQGHHEVLKGHTTSSKLMHR